jgi:hypothetical protein
MALERPLDFLGPQIPVTESSRFNKMIFRPLPSLILQDSVDPQRRVGMSLE